MRKILSILLISVCFLSSKAAFILIPMDNSQKNHLKAYGIAYLALTKDIPLDWLLNYRGGTFALPQNSLLEKECLIRNVKPYRHGSVMRASIWAPWSSQSV